jgi:hypothetical protein
MLERSLTNLLVKKKSPCMLAEESTWATPMKSLTLPL